MEKVFYFTARIKMRYKGDTSQHRQHKYFRVLKDQGIEIVEGKFIKTLHPRKGSGSEELRSASSKFEELHTTWLADSQLGRVFMTSKGGNIVRPEEWQ